MGLLSLASILASLLPVPQDEAKESPLGAKVVQMRNAYYLAGPDAKGPDLGKALYGDQVTVTAIEGRFAKVTRKKDGSTAYISKGSLIAEEKFDPHPENEEEKVRLSAQNYKAGRFDKTVEDKFIDEKGPKMKAAYADVDGLEKRYTRSRADVLKDLAAFQKGGKLGSYSTVR